MELTFRLKKSSEYIFDYLTNMQKFVSVHPVISHIDKTGNAHYLVHETLKVGFIPFSFTYPVSIIKNRTEKIVILNATVFKIVKVEMKFVLKEDNEHTIVEENIQFKSHFPIKFFMKNIFKKQHHQLFKNIEMS